MIKLKEYTSVFRKPDMLILVVIISYVVMCCTILYQSYIIANMQNAYMKAGLWIDSNGTGHIENVKDSMIVDIIPYSNPLP